MDWEGAGLSAPSSTWTYTINDDLTESNLIRGLADNPAVMLLAAPMIPLLLVYGIWQRLRTSRTARPHGSVSDGEDSDERGRV